MGRYNFSIDAAIKTVLQDGVEDIKPHGLTGVGRPSGKKYVNGVLLDREGIEVYEALIEFWKQMRAIKAPVMSDEEFVVFMKDAAPKLHKRMVDMAMVSDDLKAIRQVASDLADRGYGKAASQVNINISQKDIRGAWKQLEDRNIIDVSHLVEDLSNEAN